MMKSVHQGEAVNPISYYSYTGTVSFVEKTRTGDGTSGTGDRMVVSVPDGTPLTELSTVNSSTRQPSTVGVQLSFDETSYRTMFDALERVMRPST